MAGLWVLTLQFAHFAPARLHLVDAAAGLAAQFGLVLRLDAARADFVAIRVALLDQLVIFRLSEQAGREEAGEGPICVRAARPGSNRAVNPR